MFLGELFGTSIHCMGINDTHLHIYKGKIYTMYILFDYRTYTYTWVFCGWKSIAKFGQQRGRDRVMVGSPRDVELVAFGWRPKVRGGGGMSRRPGALYRQKLNGLHTHIHWLTRHIHKRIRFIYIYAHMYTRTRCESWISHRSNAALYTHTHM